MLSASDMIIMAFFFLLRPREYTDSVLDATPFTLGDVHLFVGTTRLDIINAPDSENHLARAVMLTFTKQKNGVKNKVLRMGLSGNPLVCAVKALTLRVCHLQTHNVLLLTPHCTRLHWVGTARLVRHPGSHHKKHRTT